MSLFFPFRKRAAAHRSTVFHTNIPPTFPFFVSIDPHVVTIVDAVAFTVLFDPDLIDFQPGHRLHRRTPASASPSTPRRLSMGASRPLPWTSSTIVPAVGPSISMPASAPFSTPWLALQILPTQKYLLYRFIKKHGAKAIAYAETQHDIGKKDAINNILFVLGFNAFSGFSVFLPFLVAKVNAAAAATWLAMS
ncbi:linolenate hydroperoxide lyase, chloroplastic-like [Miscanthus floridulus]|uniref:linolenate hydroperoxide lyase, chloroplastic-like n=1 Tax=Miscanthus floridulus TaxID=154761 RepID=UPI00345A5A65